MWEDKQCVAFCFNVLKTPSNPCLCQRLISSRTELEFYNSGIVSFVIKPPLWWNYILVYFLVSAEYFSMIISFKLSLSLSLFLSLIDLSRRSEKSRDDFRPRKTHSSVSCFLLRPLIPFPCQGCLALSAGAVALRNKTNSLPPPSLPPFSHCSAQKRKQLKRNLLDCLCLYHLREASWAVMIITHCWIIIPNPPFYPCLSLSVWMRASERWRAGCHTWHGSRARGLLFATTVILQVINLNCLFFCFSLSSSLSVLLF